MLEARTRIAAVAAGTAIALFAALPHALADSIKLTAVSGLQQANPLTKSFLKNFVEPLNESGGPVTIDYVGGQNVVPPRKAARAVKRGQFDVLNSPVSYYIGTVPEGYAMLASNVPVAELRKNGGWELLNKIFHEKSGMHLIAWAEGPTQYNTYLTVEPKFDENGVLDLSGIKMRATGTYRPFFEALGASTINMKSSEIYTGLKRGVVQGFGWPETGVPALGLHTLAKYWIHPGFYATNQATTMNLEKWKALTEAQKDALRKAIAKYEEIAPAYMEEWAQKDARTLEKAGVEKVVLEGEAAAKYLSTAYNAIWEELAERSKYADALRAKLYHEPSS